MKTEETMVSQTNFYEVPEVVTGYPMSPSSSSTPRGWWSRPIATYPAKKDREPTCTEWFAFGTPYCGGLFTVVAILSIFLLIDRSPSHAKFSIQSINVSPSASAATWHVEFLVKNPSSRYSICYDGDDASVRLGPLNVIVLNMSHRRVSRDVTALSLDFVAQNDVVSEELHVKLRGKHKRYVDVVEAGHFDVTCQNLTPGQIENNVDKIICQSSFTHLHTFDY